MNKLKVETEIPVKTVPLPMWISHENQLLTQVVRIKRPPEIYNGTHMDLLVFKYYIWVNNTTNINGD